MTVQAQDTAVSSLVFDVVISSVVGNTLTIAPAAYAITTGAHIGTANGINISTTSMVDKLQSQILNNKVAGRIFGNNASYISVIGNVCGTDPNLIKSSVANIEISTGTHQIVTNNFYKYSLNAASFSVVNTNNLIY